MECRVTVPEECYHIKNRSKKKETMESSYEPKINKQGSQVLEGVFGGEVWIKIPKSGGGSR